MDEVVSFVFDVFFDILGQLIEMLGLFIVGFSGLLVRASVAAELLKVVVARLCEVNSGLPLHVVSILADEVFFSQIVWELLFLKFIELRLFLSIGENHLQVLDLVMIASES